MATGRIRKCHIDQLIVRTVSVEQSIPTPLIPRPERDTSEVPDNQPEEPESNASAPNVEPLPEPSNNEISGKQTQNEPAHHPVLR